MNPLLDKNKIISYARDLGIFTKTFFDYLIDTSFSSLLSLFEKDSPINNSLDKAISLQQEGEMTYRLARIFNSEDYMKIGKRRIKRGEELKERVYRGII